MGKIVAGKEAIDEYGHVQHYELISMLWKTLIDAVSRTDGPELEEFIDDIDDEKRRLSSGIIKDAFSAYPQYMEVDFRSQSYEGEVMQVSPLVHARDNGLVRSRWVVRYVGENFSPDYVKKSEKEEGGLVSVADVRFFCKTSSTYDARLADDSVFLDYLAEVNDAREKVFLKLGIHAKQLLNGKEDDNLYAVPVIKAAYELSPGLEKNLMPVELSSISHPLEKNKKGQLIQGRSQYDQHFIKPDYEKGIAASATFRICFMDIDSIDPIYIKKACRPPTHLKEAVENHPAFYKH